MSTTLQQNLLRLRRQYIESTLTGMNDRQKEAVLTPNGPLLILAGAGSGKTTVLIARIAALLQFGDAYVSDCLPEDCTAADEALLQSALAGEPIRDPARLQALTCTNRPRPYEILAITFTNKAAGELKERLTTRLGEEAAEVWAFTFHAACLRMLRRSAAEIGFSSHFSIYDTDDAKRVIKECQKELSLDDKAWPHRMLLWEISQAKDRLISPAAYRESAGSDPKKARIAAVYALYQQKLKAADAMDFDDIITHTVTLLTQNEGVRDYWQNRFRYILVDEYQDTNHAQYELVRLLAGRRRNLCVVGDDNQSIYTFRGATIENILNFEAQYQNAVTVRLEQNYRSTGLILQAANAVIGHNRRQKEKTLWTDLGDGQPPVCYTAADEFGESRFVADAVLEGVSKGRRYSDFAVLYRMNAQSGNLETTFMRSGIPYRIIGGLKFYERKEIRDMLAYLHLIVNPNDDLRLRRVINEPKRGIGASTVDRVAALAAANGFSMLEVCARADEFVDLQRAAPRLLAFADLIAALREEAEEAAPHELLQSLLQKTGYGDALAAAGEEGAERLENVKELLTALLQYEKEAETPSLDDYLDGISLMTDIDQYNAGQDCVVMMTIHAAKGLEFHTVFLVGLEEGIFPGNQSIFAGESAMEEERRLMYVAITRARRQLYLLNASQRMLFGVTGRNRPSRFLAEIPPELLRVDTPPRPGFLAGSGGQSRGFSSPRRQSAAAFTPPAPAEDAPPLQVGDRVRHKTFGAGVVTEAKPVGGDVILTVAFEAIGTKKMMQKHARLQKE